MQLQLCKIGLGQGLRILDLKKPVSVRKYFLGKQGKATRPILSDREQGIFFDFDVTLGNEKELLDN